MKTLVTSIKPARPVILSLSRLAPLLVPLLVALTLRLLLWDHIPRTGLISDEGEYLSAASWLAHGRGFAWYHDYLWTRAPLYPLFVAIHLRLFGDTLVPVWISQTILSLVNVALVYLLARHLFPATDSPDKVTRRQGGKVTESLDHSSSMTGTRSPAHPLTRSPVQLRGRWSIPTLAALLMAVYFPFALYPQMLLSETLFLTLLLGGFLALARWSAKNTSGQWSVVSGRWSVAAGVLFGLATLTRSLTLFFLPIVTLWLLTRRPTTDDRRPTASRFTFHVSRFTALGSRFSVLGSRSALCFAISAAVVILPWSAYNSRLYGGMVAVDTSGAFNLLLGGRTAYDGGRQDAPARNFVLVLLDKNLDPAQRLKLLDEQRSPDGRLLAARSCLLDRQDAGLQAALERPPGTALAAAERQRLMMAEGLCFISARPGAFVAKSLLELADLFQINYSGDERFSDGYTTGRLPPWYALGLFVLDDTLYILALPLAVLGWALARRLRTEDRGSKIEDSNLVAFERLSSIRYPLSSLIGLWWLYNIAVAPLLFAINRFRLPLLPFAFIFVAYTLVALPARWRLQHRRGGLLWVALAALLLLVATTPYAYLQPPRDPAASSQAQPVWTASYLGPDPSSLSSTGWALARRARYQATERLQRALGAGNLAEADVILRSSELDPRVATLGRALLAGQQGRYDEGLAILEADRVLAGDTSYRPFVGVVRGDLLRAKGDLTAARAAFTPEFVDNANPVQWAWDWLRPTPLPDNSIDLAGNLDLGYIEGCYLGEGDSALKTNFRWCTDGARLRFPGAGTGAPQALVLRADGRFWPDDMLPVPPVRVLLAGQEAGAFTPDHAEIRDFVVVLPPAAPGADVVVTLRTPVFIPSAADYLKQQGALVGQARRLGVRLDWVELREPGP